MGLNDKKDKILAEKLMNYVLKQYKLPVILHLLLILCSIPVVLICGIIEGAYQGIRLAIEEDKEHKKNEEKTPVNNKNKSYKADKENILVRINFPQYVYTIGSIVIILLLLWFYTSTWVKSSYNQIWVLLLTLSAFLTVVNVHYLSKPKGAFFNKITRTITITGLLFAVGVFPLSMSIVGILILAIFNQGVYSRLTEPFGIGWLGVSIIIFLFQIPKIIDFNSLEINYHYSKGDKLYNRNKYEEAIAEYDKALELEGVENFYYYYAVGLAYMGMNNNERAKQMLKKASRLSDYTECYYALADMCLTLENYTEGIEYIDKLLNKLDKNSNEYKKCEQFKADYLKRKENADKERRANRAKSLYEEAIRYKNSSEYGKAKNSIKQAIELEPDNKNYETLLQEIQKSYKEEKAKFEELYNKAINLKEEGRYQKSLNIVEEAYRIAKKQDISTANLDKLNKELSSIFKDLKNAEEKYNTAMKLYKNKEFSNAVFNMERAISLAPNNDLYQNKLAEIKNEWDKQKTRAEELFFEAKSHLQNNDFSKALSSINSALNMIIDNRYTELKSDIERQQKQVQNEKDSEKLYKEAEKLYNSNNINYERIIELLESANKKYSKAKYQDFLKSIKTERNTIQAEKLYEKAKKDFENKNYEPAISSINEAIKLIPSNNMYIDLKQKITWEQRKYESDQYAEKSYKTGVKAYNDGDFTNAVANLTKACNEKPDNEEWQKVLEKAKTGKIDIMYCSKKGLLSLDCIDDNMAEQIIKSRNDGNIWYGYEEFCKYFQILQPHEQLDVAAKIVFPLKQGNKYGRRLDI